MANQTGTRAIPLNLAAGTPFGVSFDDNFAVTPSIVLASVRSLLNTAVQSPPAPVVITATVTSTFNDEFIVTFDKNIDRDDYEVHFVALDHENASELNDPNDVAGSEEFTQALQNATAHLSQEILNIKGKLAALEANQ